MKILGKTFINNNQFKGEIIYNKHRFDLKEYFEDFDDNDNKTDKIKLLLCLDDNIHDISYLFYKCDSLISLSDSKTKLKTKNMKSANVIQLNTISQKLKMEDNIQRSNKNKNSILQIYISNMKYMFYGCHNLYDLFDISN